MKSIIHILNKDVMLSEILDSILSNWGRIVTLLAILGVGYKIGVWIKGIDERIKKIEENPILVASSKLSAKILSTILFESFERNFKGNPLTSDEIRQRRELTEKLDAKTITSDDAKTLHDILQKELIEATATNNILAFFAILLLIGLVIAFLSK